jgi:hypothetical protein
MRIKVSPTGDTAPNCKVEPAHISHLPTVALPVTPLVPRPHLYDTTHRPRPDRPRPDCSSPAGRSNSTEGCSTQSSEQASDIYLTTTEESEDVSYHDWMVEEEDDEVEIARVDSCIDRDDLDPHTRDFCDPTKPPSQWYPDETTTTSSATVDPAHLAIAPLFADSPSSSTIEDTLFANSPSSSTFEDTTRYFDETLAPTREVPQRLRKSVH